MMKITRIEGTDWDRDTCAEKAAWRVQVGDISEPDNNSLDFALWALELLKENDRLRVTDSQQLAALVEQLRHACSVAFGDLLAQGMPPGVSTGKLLQAAIGAAEEYLAPKKVTATQTENKVIRNGKVAVLYSSGYGWGWHTHNDDPDGSMLFDPEMVAAVEAGDFDAQCAIAKRKWPHAATPPVLSIAWVPQGSRFDLDVHDGEETVQVLHPESGWLA